MSFKWLFFDSLGFVWSLYLSDARFVHPCQQAAIKFLLHMCMCISPTPSVNALAFQKSGVYHQVARLCLIHSFSSIFGLFIHESFGCQDIQFLLKLFWGLQSPPQPVVLNIYMCIYTSAALGTFGTSFTYQRRIQTVRPCRRVRLCVHALYFCQLLKWVQAYTGIVVKSVLYLFLVHNYFCLFGIFRDIVTGGTDGTLFCNLI